MAEISWDIPFDPAEVGNVPMFVWCPTQRIAQEFIETYLPNDRPWLEWWSDHREETIYTLPFAGSERYMYGPRNSIGGYISEGYVPRIFDGQCKLVEVGDLL